MMGGEGCWFFVQLFEIDTSCVKLTDILRNNWLITVNDYPSTQTNWQVTLNKLTVNRSDLNCVIVYHMYITLDLNHSNVIFKCTGTSIWTLFVHYAWRLYLFIDKRCHLIAMCLWKIVTVTKVYIQKCLKLFNEYILQTDKYISDMYSRKYVRYKLFKCHYCI